MFKVNTNQSWSVLVFQTKELGCISHVLGTCKRQNCHVFAMQPSVWYQCLIIQKCLQTPQKRKKHGSKWELVSYEATVGCPKLTFNPWSKILRKHELCCTKRLVSLGPLSLSVSGKRASKQRYLHPLPLHKSTPALMESKWLLSLLPCYCRQAAVRRRDKITFSSAQARPQNSLQVKARNSSPRWLRGHASCWGSLKLQTQE